MSSYLTQAFRCGINRELIADVLTARHSAFNSFTELLNAKGSYRPSLCMRDAERIWLANHYDAAMEELGDDRRAYRYGAETPEGVAAQALLTEILVEARLIEPPAPAPVAAPTKRMTLRGPGGIRLVLDPEDIAPAMVYSPFMRHSASYSAALNQSVLNGNGKYENQEFDLNFDQINWLDAQQELVLATERVAPHE